MIIINMIVVASELLLGFILFFYVTGFFIKVAVTLLFKPRPKKEEQPVSIDFKNIKLR